MRQPDHLLIRRVRWPRIRSLRTMLVESYPPSLQRAGLPAALTDLLLRDLAQAAGGTLDVMSTPGVGTQVRLEVSHG